MSRKHYIAIAKVFYGDLATCITNGERNKVRGIIFSIADVFAQADSHFDRERFYLACGLVKDESGWNYNLPPLNR